MTLVNLHRSRGWRNVFAAICLSLVVFGCWAQEATLDESFRRGAEAMRVGDTASAESHFRQAVALAPQLPDAYLDLGLVLGREGKLEEATSLLKKALELDASLSSANMFLGIFYFQLNLQTEARAAFERELGHNPANAETLMWLGMVELASGNAVKAIAPLDRAAELDPKNPDLLEARGRAHNLVARDSFAQMARLDPNSWHVHRVQAELYADEGKHSESIAEFAEAIRAEPRVSDLHEELGDEYRKANQLDMAEASYAKELELSPRNPVAIYDLGSVQIDRGDYERGIERLLHLPSSYVSAPVVQYYLGRGLAALNRNEEAVQDLERSARSEGQGEVSVRSYYELSRIYRKLKLPDEARRCLTEYLRLKDAAGKREALQIEDWRKLSARPL